MRMIHDQIDICPHLRLAASIQDRATDGRQQAAEHATAADGRPQVIDIQGGIAVLAAPCQAVAAADAMFHGVLRWNETGGGWNKSPGTWNKSAGNRNENRASWNAPGTGLCRPRGSRGTGRRRPVPAG
jgi:hypothetical protein